MVKLWVEVKHTVFKDYVQICVENNLVISGDKEFCRINIIFLVVCYKPTKCKLWKHYLAWYVVALVKPLMMTNCCMDIHQSLCMVKYMHVNVS